MAKYGVLGTYTYTWYDMGTTDADGGASIELLSNASYKFSVTYEGIWKETVSQTITQATEVVFQT